MLRACLLLLLATLFTAPLLDAQDSDSAGRIATVVADIADTLELPRIGVDTAAFTGVRGFERIREDGRIHLVDRRDVLHCDPPICRLRDLDALIEILGEDAAHDGIWTVLVRVWGDDGGRRGAHQHVTRYRLAREPDGAGYRIVERVVVMVS